MIVSIRGFYFDGDTGMFLMLIHALFVTRVLWRIGSISSLLVNLARDAGTFRLCGQLEGMWRQFFRGLGEILDSLSSLRLWLFVVGISGSSEINGSLKEFVLASGLGRGILRRILLCFDLD